MAYGKREPTKDALSAEKENILKHKAQAAEAAARVTGDPAPTKSATLKADDEPTSTANDTAKARTPYLLRKHRTTNAASTNSASTNAASTAPTGEGELVESNHPMEQRDPSKDLFGEDYDRAEPPRRMARRQLNQRDLETKGVEQLEAYAISQSQDVTQNIDDCVRVAEDTVGVASNTMVMLHEQGEQINRAHVVAVKVEEELTLGERVLGSLGGMFSRRWKPKKGEKIKGPQAAPDSYKRKTARAERAAVLSNAKFNDAVGTSEAQRKINKYAGLSETQVQLEMEKEHQDEALSGLGDVVLQLKSMTSEMNEEVEKQTVAIGQMEHDVDTVDNRVKQSYNRARYLVGR